MPRTPIMVALVAVLAIFGIFLADFLWARQAALEDGRERLQQLSVMLAGQVSRSLARADWMLQDVAVDLASNGSGWTHWDARQGWKYLARRHSRGFLPQVYALELLDAEGQRRFASTAPPLPAADHRNQPYFKSLEQGGESARYGPHLLPGGDRYVYTLTRRIYDQEGKFTGLALAAMDPGYFPEFCWGLRLADDFEALVINTQGRVIASCRPVDMTQNSPVLGAMAEDVLFAGRLRGKHLPTGAFSVDGLMISLLPLPGNADLRLLSVLPEGALTAPLRQRARVSALLLFGWAAFLFFVSAWIARQMHHSEIQRLSFLDRIHEASAELAYQKEESDRAGIAKSRFLAAASHDLRQPLHALSLFAADLKRQVHSDNPVGLSRLSEHITASIRLLGELLDSLLNVSRLDVEGIQTHIRPLAIQTVFDRLAAAHQRPARARRLTLRFRPSPEWALSDINLVERLLSNLVSNAIRYTPEGGRVLIAARCQGERLRIEVRDNGIGIAPEHQASIFAEFYQIGNIARESNKGLGLGLSIVDRLAYGLGAPIYLKSRPGAGTTFAVALPRCAPSVPDNAGPAPVLVVGIGRDLENAARLVRDWGLKVRQLSSVSDMDPGAPAPSIAISEAVMSVPLRRLLPECTLIAFTNPGEAPPEGAYPLTRPIRPAKLRALLERHLPRPGTEGLST